jgi:glutamate carboxypeptidase
MTEFLDFFNNRLPDMVATLKRLAQFESPTGDKAQVDRLGAHVAELCESLGATVETCPREAVGDIRVASWPADAPGPPLLFLMHLDTVWPVGTLAEMPLREENGRLYGPGVADMKGGIVAALEAVRGLRERGEFPRRPVQMIFTSDEETGSRHSRDLIHERAAGAGLVLVMEPGMESGAVKTWRKGMARYTVRATGRASHAGMYPEAGINAVIEAAHQALYLHGLNDLPNGTSVSVTMIEGGFTFNVIPPEAELKVDVRFLKATEARRVDDAIQALGPVLPGAAVTVEGGIDRGPMEHDDQMRRVVDQLKAVGASIGLEVHTDGSGGASDGNFTAAMGVPTLDGMGPAGVGLHAAHEHILLRSLPRRAALLARLLVDWDTGVVQATG